MATKKQTTSYTDLLNDFNKFQDRDTAVATGIQSALAIGNIFKGKRAAEMLKYTPPARMQARTVNLSTPDLASGATRALDRAFASSVNAAREAGRTVGGDLLDAYGRNTREIADAQGKAYQQTQNKAEELNFQAGSQADAYNFQQSAQDAQIEAALRGKKSGIYSNTTDQTMEMIANTINLRNAATLNKFQAGVDLKPYMDAEAAAKAKLRNESRSEHISNINTAATKDAAIDYDQELLDIEASIDEDIDPLIYQGNTKPNLNINDPAIEGQFKHGTYDPTGKVDRNQSMFSKVFEYPEKPFYTPGRSVYPSTLPIAYKTPEKRITAPEGFGDRTQTGFGGYERSHDVNKRMDEVLNKTQRKYNAFEQAGRGLFGADVYGLQGQKYNFPARSSYKGASDATSRNPTISSVMNWISSF